MGNLDRFKKNKASGAAATGGGAARPPAQQQARSRYSGVNAQATREGWLPLGDHLVCFAEIAKGFNPKDRSESHKAYVTIVETDSSETKVGARHAIIQKLTGDAATYAFGRVKTMVMAATGFEVAEEEEFNSLDPDGYFLEACEGASNEFSKLFDGVNPIVGRYAFVSVTRGKEVKNKPGEYYTNLAWTVVPEDEQPENAPPGLRDVVEGS